MTRSRQSQGRRLAWMAGGLTLVLGLSPSSSAASAEDGTARLVLSEPSPATARLHARLVAAETKLHAGGAAVTAVKAARRVAEQLVEESWHDPRAIALLAESALLRAVAEARAGDEAASRWSYATALAIDARLHQRDLDAFGAAAVALATEPRRVAGRPPPGIVVDDQHDPRVAPPRLSVASSLGLSNPGAWAEPPPPVVIEVLIDRDGRLSDPVELSHSHPIALYRVLEALRDVQAEPARRGGNAVPVLYPVSVDFTPSRWGG